MFLLCYVPHPCPCGYLNDPEKECTCTPSQIRRYRARLSGPVMDRIDIHIDVPRLKYEEIVSGGSNSNNKDRQQEETSHTIRERIISVREIQQKRYKDISNVSLNADLSGRLIERYCKLTKTASFLLKEAFSKLGLSGRAYTNILKISRTIADMEHKELIDDIVISEAIQYRSLDKDPILSLHIY